MNKQPHNHAESEQRLFSQVEAPFSRSKERLWAEMEAQLSPTPVRSIRSWQLSLVASVLLLVGLLVGAYFFEQTHTVPAGQRATVQLPDGSQVSLNADSRLSYHPLRWYWERTVALAGEAFFEVQKGSQFTVTSPQGWTQVLGTSFNVFARGEQYRVFCATGKVSVRLSPTDSFSTVLLLPNQLAEKELEHLETLSAKPENAVAWREGNFHFESLSLAEIIAEIERHYRLKISLPADLSRDKEYTAHFKRFLSADSTLELLGATLQLNHRQSPPFTIQPSTRAL